MHTPRWAAAPVIAAVAALLLVPAPAQAADRDCGSFSTQAAAQRFFLAHNPSADPHYLDSDGDRIACESNPCPCNYDRQPSGPAGGGTSTSRQLRQHARVVRVIDGDTVDVRRLGHTERVRLIGIDTPEVYGGVECGGHKASASLRRLLPRGARVTLISDPSQDRVDRYGRQLRYVQRHGHDVNKIQVARGRARVYVYNHNPFRRVTGYRHAQRTARAHNRGIWRAC